jgi:hypothetical protein
LAVTIDNASDNNIFMGTLNKKFQESVTEIFNTDSIFHIFYLIYVIQLAVKIMMGRLKIEAKNDSKEINWEGDKVAEKIKKATGIARILDNVTINVTI